MKQPQTITGPFENVSPQHCCGVQSAGSIAAGRSERRRAETGTGNIALKPEAQQRQSRGPPEEAFRSGYAPRSGRAVGTSWGHAPFSVKTSGYAAAGNGYFALLSRKANNGFGCEVRRRKAGKLSFHCTGGRNGHAPRQGQAYYSGSYPVSSGKPWRADWLRASSSQRSFSACPLCPRTHSSVTLWRSSWTCRRSQRSRFLTGFLAAVFQPFFRPCAVQRTFFYAGVVPT